ncbi:SpoVG family protein [Faecalispora anaeroviscerum]|uniref:SpoVG family protein n=1 Tax=Faecalispora anaeroviscerum TaxID=2991836 RepID=UPI0024B92E22|nr:SpoVG family protein [Faecalispora anaeroviscerum]
MNETAKKQTTVPESAEQSMPMKVDVKIGSIRPEGSVRAIASVNLNNCFAIRNVKVVDSSKGPFVAMPSYKAGNGEYKDICFPVTAAFRQQLNTAVLDAYHQALTQSPKAAVPSSPEKLEQNSGMQMGGM